MRRPAKTAADAMLSKLLTEGTGPAYTDSRGDLLARRLHDARVAMGA